MRADEPGRERPGTQPNLGELRLQLAESQAIVEALRRGKVDALVREAGIILLGDAEKPYVAFFQAMREGGFTLDADGRFLNCNGRFADLVGTPVAKLQGRAFAELVAPADRPRVADMLAAGRYATEDLVLLDSAGRGRPVSLSATPLEVGGQHLVCVLVTDQTERVARNAALLESELKYRLLAENATDWVFWIDRDDNFRYCSSASESLTGYPPSAFIGDSELMHRIVHPDDRALFEAHAMTCGIQAADEVEIEFRIVHRDGSVRWLAHSCRTMVDADGRAMGRRGSNRDVTERRELAEALARQNQQLEQTVAHRTAELIAARDVAEASNRAKSVFLANMSHEMRTPLNGMLGMVHLLLRSRVDTQQADRLGKILASGEHLLRIINDILDLARIESGRVVLQAEAFAPREAVRAAIAVVADGAAAKGIAIESVVDALPMAAVGDHSRFVQALVNYLGNAVKFTERGRIVVRGQVVEETERDTLVRIEVEDTGIGVPADELPRLFEPFEQADTSTTRRFGGTGLGLAITRRVACLMGGETGASSTPGRGSTFWLTARLGRASQPRPGGVPEQAPAVPPDLALSGGGRRVLIVEDDLISAEVTAELLRAVGLVPERAVDGTQALRLARAGGYAAILMDMHMPVLDGVEAARLIRSLPAGAEVPIIGVTADAFADARDRCLAAGMNEVIVKPFEPERLYAALDRWLGNGGAARNED